MSGILLGGNSTLSPNPALKAYALDFETSNWSSSASGVTMSVPAATHGKTPPFVLAVYQKTESNSYTTSWGAYTDVYWAAKINAAGDVTLTAGAAFAGRLVLV